MWLQYSFPTSLPWHCSGLYNSFLITMTHMDSLPIKCSRIYTVLIIILIPLLSDTLLLPWKNFTLKKKKRKKKNYVIMKVLSHGDYYKLLSPVLCFIILTMYPQASFKWNLNAVLWFAKLDVIVTWFAKRIIFVWLHSNQLNQWMPSLPQELEFFVIGWNCVMYQVTSDWLIRSAGGHLS